MLQFKIKTDLVKHILKQVSLGPVTVQPRLVIYLDGVAARLPGLHCIAQLLLTVAQPEL